MNKTDYNALALVFALMILMLALVGGSVSKRQLDRIQALEKRVAVLESK